MSDQEGVPQAQGTFRGLYEGSHSLCGSICDGASWIATRESRVELTDSLYGRCEHGPHDSDGRCGLAAAGRE